MNYNLDEGAVLSEIKRYSLHRDDPLGLLIIEVHRIMAGPEKEKYLAMPTLIPAITKRKYIAAGETEDEALSKCLNLVKGICWKDIIESD